QKSVVPEIFQQCLVVPEISQLYLAVPEISQKYLDKNTVPIHLSL
ncbi:14840_t:CDS:1, partial [Funneliformis geosporum]